MAGPLTGLAGAAPAYAATGAGKVRIRIVYALHAEKQAQPDWPNIGFDFTPVMDEITMGLRARFPEYTFVSSLSSGEEETQKILEVDAHQNLDGYIVYQMNAWNRVVQTLATSGKPVLYADFQYGGSGGFLVYTAGLRRTNKNVSFVASTKIDDLAASARVHGDVRGRRADAFEAVFAAITLVLAAGLYLISSAPSASPNGAPGGGHAPRGSGLPNAAVPEGHVPDASGAIAPPDTGNNEGGSMKKPASVPDRKRIESQGILFKVRVIGTEVRQRAFQPPAETAPQVPAGEPRNKI